MARRRKGEELEWFAINSLTPAGGEELEWFAIDWLTPTGKDNFWSVVKSGGLVV